MSVHIGVSIELGEGKGRGSSFVNVSHSTQNNNKCTLFTFMRFDAVKLPSSSSGCGCYYSKFVNLTVLMSLLFSVFYTILLRRGKN